MKALLKNDNSIYGQIPIFIYETAILSIAPTKAAVLRLSIFFVIFNSLISIRKDSIKNALEKLKTEENEQ